MNVFKRAIQICIVLNLVFLCGCLPKYPAVTDIENSALLKFERKKYEFASHSTTQFFSVGYRFGCGDSLSQTQYLADLSDRIPYLPEKNTDEIRVEIKDPFRIYVRNLTGGRAADHAECDIIFSFPTEENKVYMITPTSSYARTSKLFMGTSISYSCSVEVSEIADKNGAISPPKKVALTEYTECPSLY